MHGDSLHRLEISETSISIEYKDIFTLERD